MTEKISTLILRVDLQCTICSKKIKKALRKLKDRERIQSVVYDEKENVVIVSGLFDPKRLSRRLCCKACKIIKEVQIKENQLSPPPPPAPVAAPNPPALSPEPAPPAAKPAPPAAEPALPPPSKPEPEPEHVPPEPKPEPEPEPKAEPEPEPEPKAEPEPAPAPQPPTPAPEAEPEKPAPEPIKPDPLIPCLYPNPYPFQYPYPYPTVWPFIPVCGCHGWCSCKTAAEPLPSAEPYYDGCKTCQFICEDEPSICSIV